MVTGLNNTIGFTIDLSTGDKFEFEAIFSV